MYLKSSAIESLNGENYLRIYVEKQFPYSVKHNGDDYEGYDFLFKEPSMTDIAALKKLAISLEKIHSYETVKTLRIANLFTKLTHDEIKKDVEEEEFETLQEEMEAEEVKEKNHVDDTRLFLSKLFGMSSDFEDESTDYYQELAKFLTFIEGKCFREGEEGLLIPFNLSVLDKYKADGLFIREEMVIEYMSFFFDHLPSKSLHMTIKS